MLYWPGPHSSHMTFAGRLEYFPAGHDLQTGAVLRKFAAPSSECGRTPAVFATSFSEMPTQGKVQFDRNLPAGHLHSGKPGHSRFATSGRIAAAQFATTSAKQASASPRVKHRSMLQLGRL